jgi:hypothetical protein
MIRKVLTVAAAIAIPVSVVAATGTIAGAGAPKVDATNYTVSCTSITATAKFNPPLTSAGGAASNEATSISGSGSGCTVTPSSGGTPVTVSGVKIKGTINDATSTHTCGGLITPTTESGSLTAKWSASPKLTSSSSVINPTSVTGGAGADGNATFSLSYGMATSGPFQGTDSGTSSTTSAETTTSISDILTLCGGKGIKKLGITTNSNSSAPAIHLG